MNKIQIYHNPRCSKSRQAKEILEGMKVEFEVIDYLSNGLTKTELSDLMTKLDCDIKDFVRLKDIKKDGLEIELDNSSLIKLLIENSKFLERPIVIHSDRGVVARPPENLKELFLFKTTSQVEVKS